MLDSPSRRHRFKAMSAPKPPPSPISAASWSRSARRCWSMPTAGTAEGGVARLARRTTSPSCTRTSATSSWCRPARSRSAASVLKLPKGPLKLEDSQAAAAVGQIALARTWAEALGQHGITAGQVLVTLDRHRGAPALSQRALDHRQAPGMAQRAGDQRERHRRHHRDPLRRQRPPRRPRRHHGERRSAGAAVRRRRPLRRAAAPPTPRPSTFRWCRASPPRSRRWPATPRSELSRGGMRTKIEAGKIATTAGTHMVIASGHVDHPLARDRSRRPRDLVPRARQSGHLAQEMDRRLARAQGHADHRRRRRRRAPPRQEPAARRRHPRRRQLSAAATRW